MIVSKIFQFLFIITATLVCVFSFEADVTYAAACTNAYSQATPIPTGYGAAYNLFSSQRELLVQGESCSTTGLTLRVGSGAQTQYVYNKGYRWDGTQWREFTLSSPNTLNGVWYEGTGTVTVPPTSPTGTYVVGYVCHNVTSAWMCGCRDTACATRMWQLQRVAVESGTGGACGNAICELNETATSCPQDCAGSGDVKTYPAPTGAGSLPQNPDFTITVGGKASPVYQVLYNVEHKFTLCVPGTGTWPNCTLHDLRSEPAGMAYFDMNGPTEVVVTVRNRTVSTARVLPSSAGVRPVVSGNTIRVPIPRPGKYELQINGESKPLYLFANPFEVNPPQQGDANVLYYGPGVHNVGNVTVGGTGRKTVYIAGGAIVKGRFTSRDNSNVTIRGRGIIDTSSYGVRTGSPITISNGSNIDLEGFLIHDSSGWTIKLFHTSDVTVDNIKIVGQHRQNADGIDIVNSQRVEVKNMFIRANDDVFVVKGFGDNDDCCEHPQNGKYPPERNSVTDVVFKDSVITTDIANGTMEIGYELWGNEVRNIRYENIDVIHSYAKSIFGIHLMDTNMHVHDIYYNNIRVEDYHGGDVGNAWFDFTVRPNGRLNNVFASNISFTGGRNPRVNMAGPAAPNNIDNVQFKNITWNGQKLTTLAALGAGSLGTATRVVVLP